jgi:hypothetical protein
MMNIKTIVKPSVLFFAIMIGTVLSTTAYAQSRIGVAVITHSLSTSREARNILQRQGWYETSLRQAAAILVVCRSGLSWPLRNNYDNIKELDDDANSQLNISGTYFHVYIFKINDDLSVSEIDHIKYEAEE